jgi:polysaccharide biosynthesis protein PslH
MKPAGSSSCLFLAPEPLYPVAGGGAMRGASIVEYLAQRYTVDAIAFREDDAPLAIPAARDLLILDLPAHFKHPVARAARNLRRFALHRPPLLDRFSGFDQRIAAWLRGRRYDVAVVEHFWCAPYHDVLRPHADRLVLDLHNVESELARSAARAASGPVSIFHRRFAAAYQKLELHWLPQYDDVLVTSESDALRIRAPRVTVYPNTIPRVEKPSFGLRDHAIIFTGNLEYDPNIGAMEWFSREVWPRIHQADPKLEWRIAGRNPQAIPRSAARAVNVRIVGPVRDAVAEIARAKVAVVPLLAGSGTRFKILEAWAAATPVVSTPIGAEGLDAKSEEHLVLATCPHEFAEAVLRLVRDPGLVGAKGRALYLERYTTEAGWEALARIGL